MDRGAWWAAVHGVQQSLIWPKQLSTHTCLNKVALKKKLRLILEFSPHKSLNPIKWSVYLKHTDIFHTQICT